MRKLFLILLLGCGAAVAQSLPVVTVSVDPSGSCTNERLLYNIANGKLWGCDTGTWTSIGSGTGGSCSALGGDVTGTCSANTAVKINGVTLSGLATGILKNTTGTGAPSTAVAGDFPTLNQNTTGTAAGLTAAYVDWNAVSGGTSILNKPTVPTVTGGTCTNQAVTAVSSSAVPTCTTITSAYTDASIVPATRTVAGHALSSNVAVSVSDLTTGALVNGATVTTQSQNDNSTKAASTAYTDLAVANAVAGVNPAVAVQAGTTTVLPNSPTYSNGASGIGATLTAGSAAALVIDGYTPVLLDRILVKNQASAFQNGVYFLSTLGTGIIPYILTRSLDFDQPSDINNTGAIPVVNGTVNAVTQWVVISKITTVGTDAVTFTQFSANPASIPVVPVTISTSGPVTDPGGSSNFQLNNAAGALTFNLAVGVAGYQRCYRNATGKSGVITIAVTTSNAIDLNGTNGTTTTGTLVSGGAAGDSVCLWSDSSNHWYAQVGKGTWTNN